MVKLLQGDCLSVVKTLPDQSVNCVITSPPYWGLRDYKVEGQFGLEPTPDLYVQHLVELFREIKRVLRDDGTVWLNLGDSYNSQDAGKNPGGFQGKAMRNNPLMNDAYTRNGATKKGHIDGLKPKDLCGIPWRVAFALQADGWWLRSDIIWAKRNCMPESVKDRPTRSHEYIFLLSKSAKYYYDAEAIKEQSKAPDDNRGARNNRKRFPTEEINGIRGPGIYPMANKRDVWWVSTKPFKDAHFATFPEDLILPCVLAGCPINGTILDPFNGAGTTGVVALKNGRNYIGIELNPEYIAMSEKRIAEATMQIRIAI